MKGKEQMEDYLMEIRVAILGMSQKVESHATIIKKLEQHFFQMFVTLNQHQQGIFLSNAIQNLKNNVISCQLLQIVVR